MPLSAGSSSQTPCGRDLCPPNPLPHTPVCHPSTYDSRFCPDFIHQIPGNTQMVLEGRGEEQSVWGGLDKKGEVGRTFPVPLLVLFRLNPSTSSVLLPAPPEPFVYSRGFSGCSPLSTFRSSPSPIHLIGWMPYYPLRPLTIRRTHSPAS